MTQTDPESPHLRGVISHRGIALQSKHRGRVAPFQVNRKIGGVLQIGQCDVPIECAEVLGSRKLNKDPSIRISERAVEILAL